MTLYEDLEAGKEKEFDTLKLTKKVMEKFILRCTGISKDEKLLIYENGRYRDTDAEQKVEGYLEELDPNISSKGVSEVVNKIKRLTYINENEFDKDPYMINFENCWYNWLQDRIYPHSPDRLSMKQKPYPYPAVLGKLAKPKYYWKFMRDIHYPGEIRTAVEWQAATFYKIEQFEQICFKCGTGNNGKSTEDNLTAALHGGKSEISGLSLKQIVEGSFASHHLKGKSLNIDAETDAAGETVNMTELKRLSTRDGIQTVQGKHRDYEEVQMTVRFQLNFNDDPVLSSTTDGDIRRLVILSYPHQFQEGKDEDKEMGEKLTKKEELSAIFASVIAPALRRLHKNRRVFVHERTIADKRRRYEMLSDPLKAAYEAIFLPGSSVDDDYVFKSDSYLAYTRFCDRNKLAIQGEIKFSKYVANKLGVDPDNRPRRGPRGQEKEVWLGLRLNPAYTLKDGQQWIITEEGSG